VFSGLSSGTSYTVTITATNTSGSTTSTGTFTVTTLSGGVTTFAGSGSINNIDDVGVSASIYRPTGICFDTSNNLYVSQYSAARVRKITPDATVTTMTVLNGVLGKSTSLCYSAARGSLIVIDNLKHIIIEVSTDNSSCAIIAGIANSRGIVDGAGSLARFNNPSSGVSDASGNIYVSDSGNRCIRKISPSNVVTTLATFSGIIPSGITIDSSGNLYVATQYRIYKVTAAGGISLFAGQNRAGFINGNSLIALFNNLLGITIDNAGNLLVADSYNHAIRKVTPAGVVTTYAGTGAATPFTNGSLLSSTFSIPYGVAINSANTYVYIADYNNNRIRQAYYG
jgi:sugar lactone lactonase YvrE